MPFRVMSKRCDQCLMDPKNRIVPARRAAQLIRETKEADTFFVCHKSTMAGGPEAACRGHHDAMPCRLARMSEHFGIPFVWVDPETLETVPGPETAADEA